MANFRSDNESPVAEPIMQALLACNRGSAHAYGDDHWTDQLNQRLQEVFETSLRVLPLSTGTAGNSIALAELCPPWGGVLCHDHAHIHSDECGAPEFYNPGCKLVPVAGEEGKLNVETLAETLSRYGSHGVHEILPSAISLTQSTESGTVYSVAEIEAISALAKSHGLGMHMDGARFGNAVAGLGCHPADITWRAGIDMLTFGASKNGAMAAEAVILFGDDESTQQRWHGLERRRKRAGHLLSKMRYTSTQLLAYVENNLWLELASNANGQAQRFAQAVIDHPQASLAYPVQANEVFLRLPEAQLLAMQSLGQEFHLWPGAKDLARLVFSHNTSDDDTAALIAALLQSSES